ncbi:MAG: hypothetical protein IPJ19_19580 [Planctomycetes bacterium]|nr:hypothetical protein [Planctomycetota bacterium]
MGALAALGVALAFGALRRTELAPPGAIALWVADRDAGELYALDSELILAQRVALARPLDLVRSASGRLFVLRARSGTPGEWLDEFDAQGRCLRELELRACLDLQLAGESALLVDAGPGSAMRHALRLDPDAGLLLLASAPALRCISPSLDSILLGTEDGRVERRASDGSVVLANAALGGGVVDLAPTPEPGGVFALDGPGRRLLCLAPDLGLRWQAPLPFEAAHLGVVEGEERVWLLEAGARRVLRYGPGGELELERDNLPLTGLTRVLPWNEGGALVAAPGAILALDARGHLAPGQGGFNYLVALAR